MTKISFLVPERRDGLALTFLDFPPKADLPLADFLRCFLTMNLEAGTGWYQFTNNYVFFQSPQIVFFALNSRVN